MTLALQSGQKRLEPNPELMQVRNVLRHVRPETARRPWTGSPWFDGITLVAIRVIGAEGGDQS